MKINSLLIFMVYVNCMISLDIKVSFRPQYSKIRVKAIGFHSVWVNYFTIINRGESFNNVLNNVVNNFFQFVKNLHYLESYKLFFIIKKHTYKNSQTSGEFGMV